MKAGRSRTRCAIYTRKSSEEGLEQAFNSLDAQREACAAYILSQAGEGWEAIKAHYDDGGFSGGNMERPALRRLLDDVAASKIDVIVVYKVDRLTRSLSDFAKIVETLDDKGASFVSVTQAFNTTTSMGRLTLNVLLSFAQFEREVTGERIRDKIAASRKKGMWMGGNPPLGYDIHDRKLVVNSMEAETVRMIFRRYLELKSVPALTEELDDQGVRTKDRVARSGRRHGGTRFSRGALYHLLRNRVYIGDATHKASHYPGEHEAIVDAGVWENAQDLLTANAAHQQKVVRKARTQNPLQGLLYDDRGNPMTPTHTSKSRGRYRYYVSQALLQHRPKNAGSLPRVPADATERYVQRMLSTLVGDPLGAASATEGLIEKIEVSKSRMALTMRHPFHVTQPMRDELQATVEKHKSAVVVKVPFALTVRGGQKGVVAGCASDDLSERSKQALTKAIARAWRWRLRFERGDVDSIQAVAKKEGVSVSYVQSVLRLSFLPPTTVDKILMSPAPPGYLLDRLLDSEIPLAWESRAPR